MVADKIFKLILIYVEKNPVSETSVGKTP